MLNSAKIFFEILAIIFGGIFVVLTWGVDITAKREPAWEVEIKGHKYTRYREIDNGKAIEACYDANNCETVSCKLSGSFNITNTGSTPVTLGDTRFEAFFIKRSNFPKLVNASGIDGLNLTPHTLYELACAPDKYENCTLPPDYSARARSLDPSPLFAEAEGWRPYSFQIDKGKETEKFFLDHGLIIRARQEIIAQDPLHFWKNNTETATALLYLNTPCGYGAEFKPDDKKGKCKERQQLCICANEQEEACSTEL